MRWMLLPMMWLLSMSLALASAKPFECTPQNVIEASRNHHGVSALFSSPVLPTETVVELTVPQPYSDWPANKVCAVLVWNHAHETCTQNGLAPHCSRTQWITTQAKQTDNGEITALQLKIPAAPDALSKNGDLNWLWNHATLHVIGLSKDKNADDPVAFSFVSHVQISNHYPSMIVACVLVALMYFLVGFAYARGLPGRDSRFTLNPIRMTAGMYGRASISQFQVFSFSLIVAGMTLYSWLRTGVLLELSEDLLYLLGISALGAGASKYTSIIKRRPKTEVRSYLRAKDWLPPETAINETGARWQNLLLTDGKLDVYKFQMMLFSLVVAVSLLSAGITDLGVIEIPDTLLTLLGMSQTVYVGGKAISQTNVVEFEKNVKEMQAAENAYLAADNDAERLKLFKTYAKEFEEARLLFEDIFGIDVPEENAEPKMAA